MPFPQKVRRELLFKSGRRCCLCWEYRGTHIEVHHIVPKAEGGTNEESNGIPLCFDCHADVPAYNPKHPKGTKFTAEELRHIDLGECSEQSLQQNRFLLSSVVVHKSGQMGPGEGFYWLARHLGLKVGKSMFNKTRFFQHQLDLVYVHYYKGNLPAPL